MFVVNFWIFKLMWFVVFVFCFSFGIDYSYVYIVVLYLINLILFGRNEVDVYGIFYIMIKEIDFLINLVVKKIVVKMYDY